MGSDSGVLLREVSGIHPFGTKDESETLSRCVLMGQISSYKTAFERAGSSERRWSKLEVVDCLRKALVTGGMPNWFLQPRQVFLDSMFATENHRVPLLY